MESQPRRDTRWLVAATWVGMLAIVALPLSAVVLPEAGDLVGRVGVSILSFATPTTFLVAGRLRRKAWMMSLGGTLAIVLVPIVLLGVATGIALLSIFVGPVVAAVAVGLPLRETDVVAAAGFLGGGTIAVIGGFAAAVAGPAGAAGVVLVAGGVGAAVATTRLDRTVEPA